MVTPRLKEILLYAENVKGILERRCSTEKSDVMK